MNAMQRLLPAIACFLGLLIAYVDSRPTWDDTGITAGSILLVSGLLAMLADRRPWLLALTIGGWIPLYGIVFTHNVASTLALIVAFVGAYAGWLLRRGWRSVFRPA